jgi:hypothetical protein
MDLRRRLFETAGIVTIFAAACGIASLLLAASAKGGEYLGRIGGNEFCSDCTANPFAPISNPYNPNSLTNPFGPYGNPYSPYSPYNPYAVDTPKVYGTANDVSETME